MPSPVYTHKKLEDGSEEWYLNNQLHRVNGPAVVYPNGTECWYLHGQLHRVNGPAIIDADGSEYWYLYDKLLTQEIQTWLKDNGIENWRDMTNDHKLLLKLTFG